ncbi:MAG TPA: UPF0182 family protein [Pyrinomonadaceae bacterium]|jgi:uncharacterized membrane protein (UPF0182 family)
MSSNLPPNFDHEIIDVGPPARRRWRRWLIGALILLVIALTRSLSIYINALWFGSLGYASVYWYTFRLKLALFFIFALLTVIILRGAFWLLERVFKTSTLGRRTVMLNNQPVEISPARIMRPLSWAVSLVFGLVYGLGMRAEWRYFALYMNQPATMGSDPIFQKPLGFYLFSLPVHQLLSGWLLMLAFVILCAAVVFALVSMPQQAKHTARIAPPRRTGYAVISCALAGFLLMLAWRVYLSRFPYLWNDHQTFTGVTYTEDHYVLPGLMIVAVTLLLGAALALINAFTERRLRLMLAAIALPVILYVVAGMLVPGYVQSFIVKPNELGRESPYIAHNIEATRRAFGLDRIEQRDFEAETAVASFNLEGNRSTLDNIRLWDWTALRDTLRQIQEIRTYYDFQDVDVDRYRVGGEMRQMMLAAREIDVEKLPEQSRNWINERLIYTHGYGVTMNPVNGFTPEGMPHFVLSNMPVETSAPEIKVTRPEIYFGQKTNTDVYVKTRQKEFNYPQGETNNLTTYEGTGGIAVGNGLRRMLIAWALDDLSKLPFSDDVTSESRVLMRRNIGERVRALAPFLIYDDDPYIIVSDEGRLFWMIDAFTESDNYPYSRHYRAGNDGVNYIRNSVKVLIDAYNGTVSFYVFDNQDPLVGAYRATFPSLFRDASEMPADLRSHVRYPQTLMETQGQVYGLYHTQDAKAFFQREDLWSVASQVSLKDGKRETEPLEPYFVLMQLPGEQARNEFVEILPFTPANRNNMIGWIAGRSDGDAYGTLIAYNFPKSRLIDGPLQIEARIDQNAQLSSQITLWSQQGSRVRRGNLLVIPIGRALLYVEPIYLQAERSPMPELRLVVLATQDKLGYGQSFEEAMKSLFGEAAQTPSIAQGKPEQPKPESTGVTETPPPTSAPTPQQDTQQLVNQALQDLDDYQRLTAQGKLGEAGQKLESARRTLEEAKRRQKSP